MLTGLTVPAVGSSGPAEPMPTAVSRSAGASSVTWRTRSCSAPVTTCAESLGGVATQPRARIVPSGSIDRRGQLGAPHVDG